MGANKQKKITAQVAFQTPQTLYTLSPTDVVEVWFRGIAEVDTETGGDERCKIVEANISVDGGAYRPVLFPLDQEGPMSRDMSKFISLMKSAAQEAWWEVNRPDDHAEVGRMLAEQRA